MSCVDPDSTFSKKHEFNLGVGSDTPVFEDTRYLVQHGTSVVSLVFNFKLHCRNKQIKYLDAVMFID